MDWPFRSLTTYRSRLLELPPELREHIFSFVLTSPNPVVAFRLDSYQRESYQEATQPPLTRVSRQIRRESLPVFYRCNDIVLHTDSTRADDTRSWLRGVEAHLPKLHRVSLWVRYVTLTNDRSAHSGAISIPLRRVKSAGVWRVGGEWRWVTVTRKPSRVECDAKFLMNELSKLLIDDPGCMESVDGIVGLMADLRLIYEREKMS